MFSPGIKIKQGKRVSLPLCPAGLYARLIVNEEKPTPPEPVNTRQFLTDLREAVLRLHKALLESERASYEATFGKIQSPYQFLKLLTSDPWFAWLRPMSQLIAAIDEALDEPGPLALENMNAFVNQVKVLIVPTEGGEGFSRHYDEAMQRDPDVVFAHAAVAKLLRQKTGK